MVLEFSQKRNRMCPNHFSCKAEAGPLLVQAWQIVSMMFTPLPDRKNKGSHILGFVLAPDIVLFCFLLTNLQIQSFLSILLTAVSVIYLPLIDRFCPRIFVPYHTTYSGHLYIRQFFLKQSFVTKDLYASFQCFLCF